MQKLLRYLRPYTWSVLAIIALVGIQVVTTLELPHQMSEIVNVGIVQRGVEGSPTSPQVLAAIQAASTESQIGYIVYRGALMLGITLLSMIGAIGAGLYASKVSAAVARDIRVDLFSKVENFSLEEFDTFSPSSLVIRSTNDIQQIQQMTFMLLRMATMAPMTAIGAVIMAMRTNLSLSWIIGITIPLLLVTIGIVIAYGMPLFRSIQQKTDYLNLVAREGLTGTRVIRAFGQEAAQQERFAVANDELTDTAIKVNKVMVTLMPIMQILVQMTTVAIIWFGAHYVADGNLQIGDMMAFLQYAMQVLFSVLMLSFIFVMYPRAAVSAERVNEVLEVVPTITDSDDTRSLHNTTPSVEFRNVTFAFAGSEEAAVRDVSFTAKGGTTTAIIGSTGSGKTTILNLIERLYDPTAGTVLVNGVDIKQAKQQDLRQRIGYVPQKASLFSGTIAENIKFGRQDATNEEIHSALSIAQARDFVEELELGLEAPVAQGGANFSGGQKQRLAIARALVKDADIYLFDDSFSALDLKTDAALRKALKPKLTNAVNIIVAQRVTTIIDADMIIVLDDGAIVGSGTHAELLASNTIYQEIVRSQMTAEELNHE